MEENSEGLLISFREQWQRELEAISNPSPRDSRKVEENADTFSSLEDEAKSLFLKGVENERASKHYEAIRFYKRAVQLVPDIEFRIYNSSKSLPSTNVETNYEKETEELETNNCSVSNEDLILQFQKELSLEQHYSCLPEVPQTATHISALPFEIILYILRWVVTRDLDFRSLESCAQVSRIFYLCARDNELWKSACQQMWGLNVQSLPGPHHNCWRRTFVKRPSVITSGCYISKTSYIRHGENSFQDQFYRPWQLVTYYRYLRFFGGGQVLMLNTPAEPSQSVGQLRYCSCSNSSVLLGNYLISNDIITVVFHQSSTTTTNYHSNKNKRSKTPLKETTPEKTFHMEFQIQNYKSRLNVQLVWRRYSLYQKKSNGQEFDSTFDLASSRFPPLWFSRVKSYTADADFPLT